MEPLCMVALTSCVPAETLHANLHDGGIEMWGAPVGLEKLYLSIWVIMSSMLQSISWIPATNNFYQVGSREPYHKLWGSFFPLVSDRTALWHATAHSNIIHLTCNIFLCVCVWWVSGWANIRVACFGGEKTVSTMRVRIVMTCFVLLKTHCKLYQSPNKSNWKENTIQDIWLFNDGELRWRCSGPDWAWMGCMGSVWVGGVIHWDYAQFGEYQPTWG